MSPYDDYRSERDERVYTSRGAAVRERSRRRVEDDRFKHRFFEEGRYGPPRRPERFYEEDDLYVSHTGVGPLVSYDRRAAEEPPPPRLLRRQSSLDTFDRISSRRVDRSATPAPRSRRRASPARYTERDYYEDIRIAEPDYYGDEEFRHLHERERSDRHMRQRGNNGGELIREQVVEEKLIEKPYPRKGKTRMPKKLVHLRAIIELGYPFEELDEMIIILKALSKEQIDEVVTLSRRMRRRPETLSTRRAERFSPPNRERFSERVVEQVFADPRPSRSSRYDARVVERSPSRYGARSRIRDEVTERREFRTAPRPRSVSVHYSRRRESSPIRIVERRDHDIDSDVEIEEVIAGPLVLTERPRRTGFDIQAEIQSLEAERRLLQLERRERGRGGVDIIRDTEITESDGDREEIIELRRDRKVPNSRVLRAMMATLT